MSDILNNLSEEEITAYSATPETEPHIIIGTDRVITVPEELKRLGVQYDHNIETITFDCPRYWDEHDLSKMVVYINYMTPDGGLGSFAAHNVTVDSTDDTLMHFDWIISKHVTPAAGKISFLVCIRATDDDGREMNHWNSELSQECYVSRGLELEEPIFDDKSDNLTYILTRLSAVEEKVEGSGGATIVSTDAYFSSSTVEGDIYAYTGINNDLGVAIPSNAVKVFEPVDEVAKVLRGCSIQVFDAGGTDSTSGAYWYIYTTADVSQLSSLGTIKIVY